MFRVLKTGKERIRSLILIMSIVAFISEGIAIGILYYVSLNQQKQLLLNTVQSQARLIEAIVVDETSTNADSEKATANILKTINAANKNFKGFGESGEFTLGELMGDHFNFLISHKHEDEFGSRDKHGLVPMGSEYGEPMQRALRSESGTIIGYDYRHTMVIAGYEPVYWEGKSVGLVAKVDLEEFQRPFLVAGVVAYGISLLIILIGSYIFLRITNPLLEKLEETETVFRRVFDEMGVGMVIGNTDGKLLRVNDVFCRMLGFTEEEMLGKTVFDLTHPDDMAYTEQYFNRLKQGEVDSFRAKKRYVHKNGSVCWGLASILTIMDSENKPAHFVVQIQDITELENLSQRVEAISRFPLENPYPVMRFLLDGTIEFANKSSNDILSDWNTTQGGKVPDDWLQKINTVYENQSNLKLEQAFGKQFFSISLVPVLSNIGYVNLYAHDISERKKFEESLRELSGRYEVAIKASGHILFNWNLKSDEVSYSGSLETTLGYNLNELEGSIAKWKELIHEQDLKRFEERLRLCLETREQFLLEYRVRRKDGFFIDVETDGHIIADGEGRIQQMVGFIKDNTLRKKAREALEKANSEIRAFANIVSHDLRSPLLNIKGFARVLRSHSKEINSILRKNADTFPREDFERVDCLLSEDCSKSLEFIDLGVKTMDTLISRVLHLSKIGKLTLHVAEVNMNELVQNKLNVLSHQIQTKNIEVKVGDLPTVQADFAAMEQIVGNILSNAINYLSPDRPGRMEVAGGRRSRDTLFVFQDNGVGIPEKEKHKVFEIFRRGSNVTDVKGEGMGMTYVKALVEKHGGEIWFESVENEGTTFFIAFPNNPNANG